MKIIRDDGPRMSTSTFAQVLSFGSAPVAGTSFGLAWEYPLY